MYLPIPDSEFGHTQGGTTPSEVEATRRLLSSTTPALSQGVFVNPNTRPQTASFPSIHQHHPPLTPSPSMPRPYSSGGRVGTGYNTASSVYGLRGPHSNNVHGAHQIHPHHRSGTAYYPTPRPPSSASAALASPSMHDSFVVGSAVNLSVPTPRSARNGVNRANGGGTSSSPPPTAPTASWNHRRKDLPRDEAAAEEERLRILYNPLQKRNRSIRRDQLKSTYLRPYSKGKTRGDAADTLGSSIFDSVAHGPGGSLVEERYAMDPHAVTQPLAPAPPPSRALFRGPPSRGHATIKRDIDDGAYAHARGPGQERRGAGADEQRYLLNTVDRIVKWADNITLNAPEGDSESDELKRRRLRKRGRKAMMRSMGRGGRGGRGGGRTGQYYAAYGGNAGPGPYSAFNSYNVHSHPHQPLPYQGYPAYGLSHQSRASTAYMDPRGSTHQDATSAQAEGAFGPGVIDGDTYTPSASTGGLNSELPSDVFRSTLPRNARSVSDAGAGAGAGALVASEAGPPGTGLGNGENPFHRSDLYSPFSAALAPVDGAAGDGISANADSALDAASLPKTTADKLNSLNSKIAFYHRMLNPPRSSAAHNTPLTAIGGDGASAAAAALVASGEGAAAEDSDGEHQEEEEGDGADGEKRGKGNKEISSAFVLRGAPDEVTLALRDAEKRANQTFTVFREHQVKFRIRSKKAEPKQSSLHSYRAMIQKKDEGPVFPLPLHGKKHAIRIRRKKRPKAGEIVVVDDEEQFNILRPPAPKDEEEEEAKREAERVKRVMAQTGFVPVGGEMPVMNADGSSTSTNARANGETSVGDRINRASAYLASDLNNPLRSGHGAHHPSAMSPPSQKTASYAEYTRTHKGFRTYVRKKTKSTRNPMQLLTAGEGEGESEGAAGSENSLDATGKTITHGGASSHRGRFHPGHSRYGGQGMEAEAAKDRSKVLPFMPGTAVVSQFIKDNKQALATEIKTEREREVQERQASHARSKRHTKTQPASVTEMSFTAPPSLPSPYSSLSMHALTSSDLPSLPLTTVASSTGPPSIVSGAIMESDDIAVFSRCDNIDTREYDLLVLVLSFTKPYLTPAGVIDMPHPIIIGMSSAAVTGEHYGRRQEQSFSFDGVLDMFSPPSHEVEVRGAVYGCYRNRDNDNSSGVSADENNKDVDNNNSNNKNKNKNKNNDNNNDNHNHNHNHIDNNHSESEKVKHKGSKQRKSALVYDKRDLLGEGLVKYTTLLSAAKKKATVKMNLSMNGQPLFAAASQPSMFDPLSGSTSRTRSSLALRVGLIERIPMHISCRDIPSSFHLFGQGSEAGGVGSGVKSGEGTRASRQKSHKRRKLGASGSSRAKADIIHEACDKSPVAYIFATMPSSDSADALACVDSSRTSNSDGNGDKNSVQTSWRYVGHTEIVHHHQNPDFLSRVIIKVYPFVEQSLRIVIYDRNYIEQLDVTRNDEGTEESKDDAVGEKMLAEIIHRKKTLRSHAERERSWRNFVNIDNDKSVIGQAYSSIALMRDVMRNDGGRIETALHLSMYAFPAEKLIHLPLQPRVILSSVPNIVIPSNKLIRLSEGAAPASVLHPHAYSFPNADHNHPHSHLCLLHATHSAVGDSGGDGGNGEGLNCLHASQAAQEKNLELTPRVNVEVSCQNLPIHPITNTIDPVVVLSLYQCSLETLKAMGVNELNENANARVTLLGHTEWQENNTSPHFQREVSISNLSRRLLASSDATVRAAVYAVDVTTGSYTNDDIIGEVYVKLQHIFDGLDSMQLLLHRPDGSPCYNHQRNLSSHIYLQFHRIRRVPVRVTFKDLPVRYFPRPPSHSEVMAKHKKNVLDVLEAISMTTTGFWPFAPAAATAEDLIEEEREKEVEAFERTRVERSKAAQNLMKFTGISEDVANTLVEATICPVTGVYHQYHFVNLCSFQTKSEEEMESPAIANQDNDDSNWCRICRHCGDEEISLQKACPGRLAAPSVPGGTNGTSNNTPDGDGAARVDTTVDSTGGLVALSHVFEDGFCTYCGDRQHVGVGHAATTHPSASTTDVSLAQVWDDMSKEEEAIISQRIQFVAEHARTAITCKCPASLGQPHMYDIHQTDIKEFSVQSLLAPSFHKNIASNSITSGIFCHRCDEPLPQALYVALALGLSVSSEAEFDHRDLARYRIRSVISDSVTPLLSNSGLLLQKAKVNASVYRNAHKMSTEELIDTATIDDTASSSSKALLKQACPARMGAAHRFAKGQCIDCMVSLPTSNNDTWYLRCPMSHLSRQREHGDAQASALDINELNSFYDDEYAYRLSDSENEFELGHDDDQNDDNGDGTGDDDAALSASSLRKRRRKIARSAEMSQRVTPFPDGHNYHGHECIDCGFNRYSLCPVTGTHHSLSSSSSSADRLCEFCGNELESSVVTSSSLSALHRRMYQTALSVGAASSSSIVQSISAAATATNASMYNPSIPTSVVASSGVTEYRWSLSVSASSASASASLAVSTASASVSAASSSPSSFLSSTSTFAFTQLSGPCPLGGSHEYVQSECVHCGDSATSICPAAFGNADGDGSHVFEAGVCTLCGDCERVSAFSHSPILCPAYYAGLSANEKTEGGSSTSGNDNGGYNDSRSESGAYLAGEGKGCVFRHGECYRCGASEFGSCPVYRDDRTRKGEGGDDLNDSFAYDRSHSFLNGECRDCGLPDRRAVALPANTLKMIRHLTNYMPDISPSHPSPSSGSEFGPVHGSLQVQKDASVGEESIDTVGAQGISSSSGVSVMSGMNQGNTAVLKLADLAAQTSSSQSPTLSSVSPLAAVADANTIATLQRFKEKVGAVVIAFYQATPLRNAMQQERCSEQERRMSLLSGSISGRNSRADTRRPVSGSTIHSTDKFNSRGRGGSGDNHTNTADDDCASTVEIDLAHSSDQETLGGRDGRGGNTSTDQRVERPRSRRNYASSYITQHRKEKREEEEDDSDKDSEGPTTYTLGGVDDSSSESESESESDIHDGDRSDDSRESRGYNSDSEYIGMGSDDEGNAGVRAVSRESVVMTWELLGQTEVIRNSPDGIFNEVIVVNQYLASAPSAMMGSGLSSAKLRSTSIKAIVYDVSGSRRCLINEGVVIGECVFDLSQLTSSLPATPFPQSVPPIPGITSSVADSSAQAEAGIPTGQKKAPPTTASSGDRGSGQTKGKRDKRAGGDAPDNELTDGKNIDLLLAMNTAVTGDMDLIPTISLQALNPVGLIYARDAEDRRLDAIGKRVLLCDNAPDGEAHIATVYCQQCVNKFCYQCDWQLHSSVSSKVHQTHIRSSIDYFGQILARKKTAERAYVSSKARSEKKREEEEFTAKFSSISFIKPPSKQKKFSIHVPASAQDTQNKTVPRAPSTRSSSVSAHPQTQLPDDPALYKETCASRAISAALFPEDEEQQSVVIMEGAGIMMEQDVYYGNVNTDRSVATISGPPKIKNIGGKVQDEEEAASAAGGDDSLAKLYQRQTSTFTINVRERKPIAKKRLLERFRGQPVLHAPAPVPASKRYRVQAGSASNPLDAVVLPAGSGLAAAKASNTSASFSSSSSSSSLSSSSTLSAVSTSALGVVSEEEAAKKERDLGLRELLAYMSSPDFSLFDRVTEPISLYMKDIKKIARAARGSVMRALMHFDNFDADSQTFEHRSGLIRAIEENEKKHEVFHRQVKAFLNSPQSEVEDIPFFVFPSMVFDSDGDPVEVCEDHDVDALFTQGCAGRDTLVYLQELKEEFAERLENLEYDQYEDDDECIDDQLAQKLTYQQVIDSVNAKYEAQKARKRNAMTKLVHYLSLHQQLLSDSVTLHEIDLAQLWKITGEDANSAILHLEFMDRNNESFPTFAKLNSRVQELHAEAAEYKAELLVYLTREPEDGCSGTNSAGAHTATETEFESETDAEAVGAGRRGLQQQGAGGEDGEGREIYPPWKFITSPQNAHFVFTAADVERLFVKGKAGMFTMKYLVSLAAARVRFNDLGELISQVKKNHLEWLRGEADRVNKIAESQDDFLFHVSEAEMRTLDAFFAREECVYKTAAVDVVKELEDAKRNKAALDNLDIDMDTNDMDMDMDMDVGVGVGVEKNGGVQMEEFKEKEEEEVVIPPLQLPRRDVELLLRKVSQMFGISLRKGIEDAAEKVERKPVVSVEHLIEILSITETIKATERRAEEREMEREQKQKQKETQLAASKKGEKQTEKDSSDGGTSDGGASDASLKSLSSMAISDLDIDSLSDLGMSSPSPPIPEEKTVQTIPIAKAEDLMPYIEEHLPEYIEQKALDVCRLVNNRSSDVLFRLWHPSLGSSRPILRVKTCKEIMQNSGANLRTLPYLTKLNDIVLASRSNKSRMQHQWNTVYDLEAAVQEEHEEWLLDKENDRRDKIKVQKTEVVALLAYLSDASQCQLIRTIQNKRRDHSVSSDAGASAGAAVDVVLAVGAESVARLIREGGGLKSLMLALELLNVSGIKVGGFDELAPLVRSINKGIVSAPRGVSTPLEHRVVREYLTSSECGMVSDHLKSVLLKGINNKVLSGQLNQILQACRTLVETLVLLRSLNTNGYTFSNMNALVDAMQHAYMEGLRMKENVLSILQNRCTVEGKPLYEEKNKRKRAKEDKIDRHHGYFRDNFLLEQPIGDITAAQVHNMFINTGAGLLLHHHLREVNNEYIQLYRERVEEQKQIRRVDRRIFRRELMDANKDSSTVMQIDETKYHVDKEYAVDGMDTLFALIMREHRDFLQGEGQNAKFEDRYKHQLDHTHSGQSWAFNTQSHYMSSSSKPSSDFPSQTDGDFTTDGEWTANEFTDADTFSPTSGRRRMGSVIEGTRLGASNTRPGAGAGAGASTGAGGGGGGSGKDGYSSSSPGLSRTERSRRLRAKFRAENSGMSSDGGYSSSVSMSAAERSRRLRVQYGKDRYEDSDTAGSGSSSAVSDSDDRLGDRYEGARFRGGEPMDDRFGDRERYGGGRRSPRGGARGNRQRYDMESNRPYRGTRLDGIDDPYDQEAYVSESGDDTDYRRIKRVRRSSIELSQAIQQSNNKDFAHDGDYFEVETGYEQFLVPDEVKHSPSSPAVGQVLYYMNGKDCTLFKQDRATFSPEAVAALIAEGNAKTTCAALKTMQDAGLKFETVDDAVIALRVQRIADSEEVLHLQMYLKADTCHLFDQALWKPDLSFRSCQKFHDQVGIGHLTLHYVRLFNARKEKFKDLASLSAAVKREHEAEQQELRQSKAELQALFDEKMDVLFTKKVKITEAQYHKLAKTDRQIVLEVIEQLETQGERVESFDELSFLIVDRTIQAMDEKLEQYASSMNEREQQVLKVALTVHPFIAEIQHDLLQFNPFLRQMGSFAHIFNPWMVDLEAELDAMIPLVKIPTQISEFESQRFLSLFQPFVLKLQPFLTHFQPLLRNMNPFLSKCTEFVNLITPMLVLLPSLVTHSFKSIHHELHTRKKDLDQKLDAQLDAAGEMDDVILRKIHELPQILDELESLERNACETGIPTLNPVAAAAAATGSAGVFPGVLSPAPTADEIEQMNEIIKDMSSPSFHHMREELVDFLKRLRRMITPLERFVAQVSIFFEKIRSLLVRLQSFLPKILAMLDDLMRFMEPECAPGLEHLLPFVGPLRPFVSHLVPFVENILPFVHQSVPRAQALRHYRSYIQIVLMISSVLILKTGDEGKDVTKPLSFASAINNFGANTASSINKNAVNNNVTFSSGITVDTSLPAQKINNPPSALRRLPSMKGNVTFGADVNFDSGNSAGTSARPKLERFGSTGSEFDVSGLDLNFLSGLSESPGVGAENAFKQAVGELDKRGVDISMKTEVSSDSDSDSIAPLAAFGGEE